MRLGMHWTKKMMKEWRMRCLRGLKGLSSVQTVFVFANARIAHVHYSANRNDQQLRCEAISCADTACNACYVIAGRQAALLGALVCQVNLC